MRAPCHSGAHLLAYLVVEMLDLLRELLRLSAHLHSAAPRGCAAVSTRLRRVCNTARRSPMATARRWPTCSSASASFALSWSSVSSVSCEFWIRKRLVSSYLRGACAVLSVPFTALSVPLTALSVPLAALSVPLTALFEGHLTALFEGHSRILINDGGGAVKSTDNAGEGTE